ncbi:DNA double-strand break repair protein Rad50 [Columbia Basin potato purple top phytoplasma]|uniref:DNA double-strand break repair protein Rad50 n=1 Tax=Columbia Basin potato purple top phytoplasma TaxID=307134 RepID=A0ABT5L993_9MOLU|nr:DNA double-strand break repair protein Rad50 [Columbia Basin potato purple top phytoplasma]MDC9032167.1 DNA double-strand break repair protein Rad50 [Columbia Basin potato purple top phytoplasma]
MLSPLDLLKSYFTFKSYFTWFLLASILFGSFLFIKRKYYPTYKNAWKGYLIYFLIIFGCLSFIYLSFFYQPKEPSSKYVSQLINEIDKAIDKYDQTINDYKGLKSDWEGELKKCEDELKTLYEKQELNQEQKEQIKEALSKNEEKIKEIKKQLKETSGNIEILKGKLIDLEKQKAEKEKEISKKQEEAKLASLDDKIKIRAEIKKLQEETTELIGQISKIKSEIRRSEIKYESLSEQLQGAQKSKQFLIEGLNRLDKVILELSNFIITREEHKAEITKKIDEINQKLKEIETERDLYKVLKEKYRAMHNRMTTYEKENEFSFGNVFKFGFKAFDKVADLIPAKFGIKTLGKTINVTRKYAQGMGKATLVLHEGHRLWHMYNEVANENKESAPMITKETLDSYCNDIDRDLAKLDADYKDYEKKLKEYEAHDDVKLIDKKIKDFITETVIEDETNRKKIKTIIDEYSKIVEEIDDKRTQISDIPKLEKKHDELEEELYFKNEEINVKKEELKQKSPNYARAQQRFQQKRQTKIPEMVMIPNK